MNNPKQILLIVAQRHFQELEYEKTKEVLVDHGFVVKTAAERAGECLDKTETMTCYADLSIREVNVLDFSAIIFIGGSGASQYFHDDETLNLVKEAIHAGIIIGAICIAPMILANAGVLQNRKATVFSSEIEGLKSMGAIYTGNPVEVDDKIVTANGPEAATDFAHEIVKLVDQV